MQQNLNKHSIYAEGCQMKEVKAHIIGIKVKVEFQLLIGFVKSKVIKFVT